jgi:hypothetical protein
VLGARRIERSWRGAAARSESGRSRIGQDNGRLAEIELCREQKPGKAGSREPNGFCERQGRVRRCRPGTTTRPWRFAVRRAIIAAERKAASRIKLLSGRSADEHRSDDPEPDKSGAGKQWADIPSFRMPGFGRACRPGSKLLEGHLEPYLFFGTRTRAPFDGPYTSSRYPFLPTFIARVAPIWITTPSVS